MSRASRGALAAVAALAVMIASGCAGEDPSIDPTATQAVARDTPTAVPSPTPEPVTTLLFTGDIIPARCVYAEVQAHGGDWTLPFRPLQPILSGADITIGTLDATASDAGAPFGCVETFNLAGPREAIDGLTYAGFDVISHAANHIKDCGNADCGDRAMLETIANLRAAGIGTTGSGATLADARVPAIIERNGVRFAFLAYDDVAAYYHATDAAAGAAPLDETTLAADIAAARAQADVVIVLPQWGVEYTAAPSERQRAVARVAADAGAALVAGNHPHWVQGHEQVGGTFVAYALGNFLFDQDWSLETQQGALLEVTFSGARLTGWRYLPIRIHDRVQPRLADGEEAAQILGRIESASVQ